MTWEEYKQMGFNTYIFHHKELTDIECPKCGAYIYRDTGVVLTTYPAQYNYECLKCGWTGTWF